MAIQVYDLNTGKLKRKIHLQKEGPNGVGNPTSLHVVNSDSIFVFASVQFRLSLVDSNAQVLSTYRLLNTKEIGKTGSLEDAKEIYTGHVNDYFSRNPTAFLFENKLYVSSYHFSNPIVDDEFYEKSFANMRINLSDKSLDYSIPFPESYFRKTLPTQFVYEFYRTYNSIKKTMVYSFGADEYLYEYNLEGELLNKYLATSDKFIGIPELRRKGTRNSEEDYAHFKRYPHFTRIYYNPYREEYYRYVFYITDEVNFSANSSKFSIIVLDKEFNVKGEVSMPKGAWSEPCIPNKRGLIYYNYSNNDDEKLELYQLEF